jgi:hypothetical protein
MSRQTSLLVLVGLYFAGGLMAPAMGDVFVTTKPIRSADAAAIQEYWTEQRMRAAKPYPMPGGSPADSGITPSDTVPNQADGEPGVSPGALPLSKESPSEMDSGEMDSGEMDSGFLGDLGTGDMEDDSASQGAGIAGYTTPFPFTMYEVNARDIQQFPYKTVGRIFFTTATGGNSSCSGSSIGGRAVLTAGHCVSAGNGRWHRNWVFRPAYRDGPPITSIGSWPGVSATTFTAWHNSGSLCRDVGYIITANQGGLKLSQRVGALGYAWNWDSTHQHWSAFGYPAEQTRTNPQYFFNGKRMFQSEASFANYSPISGSCTPRPPCFGTYMTGGSSGGPDILKFDPTGGIYPNGGTWANGVNSHYYSGGARVAGGLCTPYFDTSVRNLIAGGVVK